MDKDFLKENLTILFGLFQESNSGPLHQLLYQRDSLNSTDLPQSFRHLMILAEQSHHLYEVVEGDFVVVEYQHIFTSIHHLDK